MNLTINYRFLAGMLVILVVLGGVLYGVHRVQVRRNASFLVDQADAAAEVGNWPEAARRLSRYIALRPKDADSRQALFQALQEMGRYEQAYAQGEAALRIDPTLDKMRLELSELAILFERFQDAKQHLQTLIEREYSESAKCLRLLGESESGLGEHQKARENYRQALAEAPDDRLAAVALADLLRDQFNAPQDGIEVLDQLVEARGEEVNSWVSRGRWALETANETRIPALREEWLARSRADADAALEMDSRDVEAVRLRIDLAALDDQWEGMRELVAAAIEEHPSVMELHGAAAQVEIGLGDVDQAVAKLQEGIQVLPGAADLLWNLAQLELDRGNVEPTEQLVQDLRGRGYPESALIYLESRILIERQQWREAASMIEGSRALFDRNDELLGQVDYMLATCYQRLGNPDQQLVALRRAVQGSPLWNSAREELANAFVQSGRFDEAISEYSQILRMPQPPVSAAVNYARLLLTREMTDTEQQADWTPVRQILDRLDELPGAESDTAILRAELASATGDAEQAETILRQRIEDDTESVGLRQALISLLIRGQQWEATEQALDDFAEDFPDLPVLRLERARYVISRYGQEAPLDELQQLAMPAEDWSEAQRVELASGFANYFLAIEAYDACQQQAEIVADSDQGRNDLRIHLLRFELALSSGQSQAMQESLEEVRRVEGRGPLWRVGEAVRLSLLAEELASDEQPQRERYLSQALDHLAEAAVERPDWARIPKLQGRIHERRDQMDVAVERYLTAVDLGEQDSQLISRLIYLLFQRGRYVDADKVVRKLQEQKIPLSSELTRMASQVSLQLENFDRALSLAQRWNEEAGTQEDRVWLAQLHSITGNEAEAEKEFRKAIEMDPKEPAGWVSLVQLLARQGESDKAREVLEEASSSIRDDMVSNALAQGYEALRDYQQAEHHYLAALERNPKDLGLLRRVAEFFLKQGDPQTALPYVERMLADKDASDESNLAWARRNLALILGTQGSDEKFARAKELLGTNESNLGMTREDQRAMAMILGSRPDRKSHRDAIDLLEEVVDGQQFAMEDHFLLARLYRKVGEWQRYSQKMRQILGRGGGDDSRVVREYAEALVDQGELSEAQLWFDRLQKLAPERQETVAIEARLLYQSRNYDGLIRLIEEKAEEPTLQRWAANFAEVYAGALRESQPSEAEQLLDIAEQAYQAIAQREPSQSWQLPAFYARQGRLDDALDQLSKDSEPGQIAEVAQAALQSGALEPDEIKRLEAFVLDAYSKASNSAALGLCLGDIQGWMGDWRNAAATYEQILKIDSNSIPALNNMAMVLALSGNRLDRAHQAIDRAVSLRGPQDYLLDTRGVVRLASGDSAAAEADFRTALETSARADRMFHLAQALLAQGRTEEARSMFEQAVSRGVSKETIHPLEVPAYEKLQQQLVAWQLGGTVERLPG